MEEYQNVGLMYQDLVNGRVKILESYLAPAAFELDGTQIRKGTWLLAVLSSMTKPGGRSRSAR